MGLAVATRASQDCHRRVLPGGPLRQLTGDLIRVNAMSGLGPRAEEVGEGRDPARADRPGHLTPGPGAVPGLPPITLIDHDRLIRKLGASLSEEVGEGRDPARADRPGHLTPGPGAVPGLPPITLIDHDRLIRKLGASLC